MSTITVDIDGLDYLVYADLQTANDYLAASLSADAWRVSDDTTKKRALVSATRGLDRQNWKGAKTDALQLQAWPRNGVDCPDAEDGVIPENVIVASIEMASALIDGSDMLDTANQSQKLQTIRAGTVSLTWFRGAEGFPQRFPQIIQELLSCLLSGSTPAVGTGARSSGTSGCSITDKTYDHNDPI